MSSRSEKDKAPKLKDFCSITSSKRIYAADYVEDGIPFVRGKEVVQRFFGSGPLESELFISSTKFETLRDQFGAPTAGDLLLTSVGTLGVPYLVTDGDEFYFKDGNLIWFRNFDGLNGKFFYYWIRSRAGRAQLAKCTIGTSQAAYTIERLKEIEAPKHSSDQQERIADILSVYDDLIDNNCRRIALLEEAARLLYREWFVHFRFPGHEYVKIIDGLPEGWESCKLGDMLAKIKRPGKVKKGDYLEDGSIPCVDQSESLIGGYTDKEDARITSPLPLVIFGDHTRVLKFIDFPFACGADGTQLLFPTDDRLSIQYFYFAVSNVNLSNYFYARHFKFLKDQGLLVPTANLISEFTDFSKDALKQISVLREASHNLARARDLLLPRLMNGEVEI